MEKIIKKTSKGNDVTIYVYNSLPNPKAVVQIVHGASEHLTRYEDFISFLNDNNFICVGGDILGHGESTHADKNYIYFEKNEAYESVTMVKDYIQATYPDLPLYLLGHSMGSFLARKLLIDYPNDYRKGIISGTTTMPVFLTGAAVFLGHITRLFRGKKGISPLLSELGMNGLPKKMIKAGLLGDGELWITHREDIAKYYQESPICGEDFTVAAYQGMFSWIDFVSKKKNVEKGNKETPILFIAGMDDPLSNFGKDIKTTVDMYKQCGYSYTEVCLYENMRHEVLNEIENKLVYNDCVQFFDR